MLDNARYVDYLRTRRPKRPRARSRCRPVTGRGC